MQPSEIVVQKHCDKIWPQIKIRHWTVELRGVLAKFRNFGFSEHLSIQIAKNNSVQTDFYIWQRSKVVHCQIQLFKFLA